MFGPRAAPGRRTDAARHLHRLAGPAQRRGAAPLVPARDAAVVDGAERILPGGSALLGRSLPLMNVDSGVAAMSLPRVAGGCGERSLADPTDKWRGWPIPAFARLW